MKTRRDQVVLEQHVVHAADVRALPIAEAGMTQLGCDDPVIVSMRADVPDPKFVRMQITRPMASYVVQGRE